MLGINKDQTNGNQVPFRAELVGGLDPYCIWIYDDLLMDFCVVCLTRISWLSTCIQMFVGILLDDRPCLLQDHPWVLMNNGILEKSYYFIIVLDYARHCKWANRIVLFPLLCICSSICGITSFVTTDCWFQILNVSVPIQINIPIGFLRGLKSPTIQLYPNHS